MEESKQHYNKQRHFSICLVRKAKEDFFRNLNVKCIHYSRNITFIEENKIIVIREAVAENLDFSLKQSYKTSICKADTLT